MKTSTIIGLLAALILLGGVVIWARPTAPGEAVTPDPSRPPVSGGLTLLSDSHYDFGTISMAAGEVKYRYQIKNDTAGPVTIEKIYTSCMCTTATLELGDQTFGPYGMPGHGFSPRIGESLAAGASATVEVIFDPAAHGPAGVGRIERLVAIETDAGDPLELSFAATVTP